MSGTIALPEGHDWLQLECDLTATFMWGCKCGATFMHDVEADKVVFEEGDGSCEEEE